MITSTLFIWIVIGVVFLYTGGFVVTLIKDGNKTGAFSVIILLIALVSLPFIWESSY